MCVWPRLKFWRALRYRLCVTGACLAYFLAALEIPLPAALPKDTSHPFPCQDHPCGCQTAEQCWTNCCCFTPQERWAWARDHHIEPPAYAEKPEEQPDAQGWNTVKLRDREGGTVPAETKSCCRKQEERSSCCRTEPTADSTQPASKNTGDRWVSVMIAWKCRGFQTLWVGIGAVLPAPPCLAWLPDSPPPSFLSLWDCRACVLSLPPPAPPPRLFLI